VDYYPAFKRLLDILLSFTAILVLSPIFVLSIFFIRIDSLGPAFFKQERIGMQFKPFRLIKFRSMVLTQSEVKGQFEPGDKSRVTRVGSFLRKTKLDELPELINVLNGDISIVGPRPEVEKYVWAYTEDFKVILKIRPGLSDYASIKYRNEEAILASQPDPEEHYLNVILPAKLHLAKRYIEEVSLSTDLSIIIRTLKSIMVKRISGNS
jgi:lipopolysaccharide/colanic/teichoic acid biosynthesis glycosyltransferase